jgi:hypothetical protein
MQIAGVCYVVNTFALILAPTLARATFEAMLVPCFVGELSLCVWLIAKGVREKEWHARVAAQ